jgi:hypothetical protein
MLYIITYDLDYKRTIPAVLIENRANIPAIKNQIGTVIKAYTDAEVAKVTETVIPYKVETNQGVLVGFFTIQLSNIGQNAGKLQQVLRPAFQPFNSDITQIINTFITNGGYVNDILL